MGSYPPATENRNYPPVIENKSSTPADSYAAEMDESDHQCCKKGLVE